MKEKRSLLSKASIFTLVLCGLGIVTFFLPLSTGNTFSDFSLKNAYNIVDIFKIIFGINPIATTASWQFRLPFVMSCILLVIVFIGLIVMIVLTIKKINVSIRRILAVGLLIIGVFGGILYNSEMTSIAKAGDNFYNVFPEFKMVLKSKTGSVNSWSGKIEKFLEDSDTVFANYDNKEEVVNRLKATADEAATIDYSASDATKREYNQRIFNTLQEVIKVDEQVDIFENYFRSLTKSVTAISSTYGIGYLILIGLLILLTGTNYSELNKNGYKSYGVNVNCVYVAVMMMPLVGTLFIPTITVAGEATASTGLNHTSLLMILLSLPKLFDFQSLFGTVGIETDKTVSTGMVILSTVLLVAAVVMMTLYVINTAKKIHFKKRRIYVIAAAVLYIAGGLIANAQLKDTGITLNGFYVVFAGLMIASVLICFTAYNDKEKIKVFSIINVVIFLIISAFILVPMWKVLVDSFDITAGYGMKLWPEKFTLLGYQVIATNVAMYKPFLISCLTTVAGTVFGLVLSTLGAYVLIQFEMPGRNFLAGLLLFTMIFQGGMIPTYLVMCELGIRNTLWAVILPLSINVYNLVLMRNFFEGIPKSLFESAAIDGCTPMGIFIKIVLPLSKAALASIGLMFAVGFWNDYTNYKIYITDNNLFNFQMKLRALIFSSDMPTVGALSDNTLKNAAIIIAILPFMILYPFCQQYFVKGVNIGAVKE